MIKSPHSQKSSFTSRLSPAPPERQKRNFPPVSSASFAPRASFVLSVAAAVASFSHNDGTLMKIDGRTFGSSATTTRGSHRYVVKPSVLPRQASPKPKIWLIGSHKRS